MTVISTEDFLDVGRTDVSDASISVKTQGQTTLLTVTGVIDGSNSDFMNTVLRGFTGRSASVVVDVSGSGLFGAQSLRALMDSDRRCRRDGVPFVVVASSAQQSLIRRLDPSGGIRTASSVARAVELGEHRIAARSIASSPRVDPAKLRC